MNVKGTKASQTETRTVQVQLNVQWNRTEQYLHLNDRFKIEYVHPDAHFVHESLLLGDRIQQVDGIKLENASDLTKGYSLLSQNGRRRLLVSRYKCIEPVSIDRAKQIQLIRQPQFIYLVATIGKGLSTVGGEFGALLLLKPRKIYVCSVLRGGLADGILAAGDAVLDIDGYAVPENEPDFVHQFHHALQKVGTFTVVVERPYRDEVAELLLFELFHKVERDRVMAADAAQIGHNAAEIHLKKWRTHQPKSILREPVPKQSARKSINFRESIADQMIISTDVTDEKQTQPVGKSKKGDAPIRTYRNRLFEDYYDVL